MAVDNTMFMIGLGYLITYTLAYRRYYLLGSIGFLGLSVATMYAAGTDVVIQSVGFILMLISIAAIITEILQVKGSFK